MPYLNDTESEVAEMPESPPALREGLTQTRRLKPLGVLLVWRQNAAWSRATPEERRSFDLEDPQVLKAWEGKVEGQIYRIYGYNGENEEAWEFFALLEFDDLEAWSRIQQRLEQDGFGAYFSWEIIAFGRRVG